MRYRLAAASVVVVFLIAGGAVYASTQQQEAIEAVAPVPAPIADDGSDEPVVLPAMAPRPVSDAPRTRVSLTFDDGWASQMLAVDALGERGMPGTFYISSGLVGLDRYLTRAEVDAIHDVGHEIGGHTVTHADLTVLDPEALELEICSSRATLARWGYEVTSFAYPFSRWSEEAADQLRRCGYNSARELGDLRSRDGCADCDLSETIPPADPFRVRAPAQVTDQWTLEDLQAIVLQAEFVGGWVPITFHELCEQPGCSDIGISVELFESFLDWLAPRAASSGTVVQTVDEVIGGGVHPLLSASEYEPRPARAGDNGLRNPGFEEKSSDGASNCWTQGVYGANDGAVQFTEGRRGTGVTITIDDYTNGEAKVLPALDVGVCAPAVEPGSTYSMHAWYRSTAETSFAVFLRHQDGRWFPWTYSPRFEPTEVWTQAEWTTPEIPRGFTAISFGLALSEPGTLAVDDHGIFDAGVPTPG